MGGLDSLLKAGARTGFPHRDEVVEFVYRVLAAGYMTDWPVHRWELHKIIEAQPWFGDLVAQRHLRLPEALERSWKSTDARGALRSLSTKTLIVYRNAVFAKHGRPFTDPELRSYFERQSWYHANPAYSDNLLTRLDKENVDVALEEERSR